MGSGPILIVFTITETAEICKFSLSDFEFFFFVFFFNIQTLPVYVISV